MSIRYVDRKKKEREKNIRVYFIPHKRLHRVSVLKRVRCIGCFYISSNVVSTALNEYTDPRELFRFVIRFFIRGILYVCLFYNVFEHRIGAIIFEQINLFDVECYVTFPTPVKKP